MGVALADLLAALKRIELEFRARRRRKKRPRNPSTPANTGAGANKGCGTGKGGFSAGNSCAKEDGIPNAPQRRPAALGPSNAKSDLAKAKSMKAKAAKKQAAKIAADKAKSEAYKKSPEYAKKQKQKKIDALRRKAAERKAAKGERDAAEKQAAAEAAAKKRAALLQKIRIKKANERLNVVEKPPSKFSGAGKDVQKNEGELETEFVKRKYDGDIKKFHSEADRIESEYLDARDQLQKRLDSIESSVADKENEMHAVFMGGLGDAKESLRLRDELAELRKRQVEAHKALKKAVADRDAKLHDLVGEFTEAHAGSRLSLDRNAVAGKFKSPNSDRAKGMDEKVGEVWAWFSKVSSPAHRDAFETTSVKFRAGGGGTHSHVDKEITIGTDATPGDVLKTSVHEYGHAIETRRPQTMKALAEDYARRRADFMAATPGSKVMGIEGCDYYECVYKSGERRSEFRSKLYDPSHLGYARRYSDAQYDSATRAAYSNDQTGRYAGGTEVYSTGVESMYFEPSSFRRRARHGFDLTLLILAGRL